MSGRDEGVQFAIGLAAFLFAVVLLLNLFGPSAVRVTPDQFAEIDEADLIACLISLPDGYDWQLKQPVRVRGQGGEEIAERITLPDVDQAVVDQWRAEGGEEKAEDGDSRWGGILLICMLVGIGVWHVWSQVQLDLKGGGSPRRRLLALEEELKQGKITEEEFKRRAEKVWPEL